MNVNLLEMAKGYLTPDVVKNSASYLGETPEATSRGLNGAIPAVLGGFVRSATRDPSGAGISRILSEGSSDAGALEDLSTIASGGSRTDAILSKGHGMLSSLFGDQLSGVVDHIAGASGLGRISAGKIFALAAPLIGGLVSREARSNKLGPAGVASMLADQKSAVASALGAGGLASLFGGAGGWLEEMRTAAHSRVEQVSANVRSRAGVTERPRAGGRNNLPLVILCAAALLGLLLWLGRRKPNVGVPQVRNEVPRAELPPAPKAENPATSAAAELSPAATPTAQAPSGTAPAIGGGPMSAASTLVQFFSNTSEAVPKRIELEGVTFAHDSARLGDDGAKSLGAIASTLQAHPSSQMRIEGFTDDTGSASHNQSLSARRAIAVRDALVDHGVDAGRIATAGMGSANPVESNDTESGRAANRRIELVMTSR